MKTYRVTSTGQVSLPADVRRRWGTHRVHMEDYGDHVVVRPVADDPIDAAYGAFASSIRGSLDETWAKHRAAEGKLEDSKAGRNYPHARDRHASDRRSR